MWWRRPARQRSGTWTSRAARRRRARARACNPVVTSAACAPSLAGRSCRSAGERLQLGVPRLPLAVEPGQLVLRRRERLDVGASAREVLVQRGVGERGLGGPLRGLELPDPRLDPLDRVAEGLLTGVARVARLGLGAPPLLVRQVSAVAPRLRAAGAGATLGASGFLRGALGQLPLVIEPVVEVPRLVDDRAVLHLPDARREAVQ